MRNRNMKRFLAVLVATTMVVGSCVTAFAAEGDQTATGDGIVEYDDSTAVEYDKIIVPTIAGATAYNFTLDPTGLMAEYESDQYGEGSVYFHATAVRANIKAAANTILSTRELVKKLQVGEDLEDPAKQWSVTGTWDGVVATVANKAIATVNPGFYVWVPGVDSDSKYSSGLPGTEVELTKDNIGNWFELNDPETASDLTIKLKPNYKVRVKDGDNTKQPCDGFIYEYNYTDLTADGITDSVDDPISDYADVTYNADTDTVTAVSSKNLFVKTEGATPSYAAVTTDNKDKIVYKPAKTKYVDYSDWLTVENPSTKIKTVTTTITVNNAAGLTFNSTSDFTGDTVKNKPAVYFAVTNGGSNTGDTVALVGGGEETKATAKFTQTLNSKTGGAENTFRTEETNNATGGHKYKRYEGQGSEYDKKSFKVVAAANKGTEAKEAWKTWAAGIETKPTMTVVFEVKDFTASYDVTFKSGVDGINDSVEPVNDGDHPEGRTAKSAFETARDGWTVTGWAATEGGSEAVDLSTISAATDLYAIWSQNALPATTVESGANAVEAGSEDALAGITHTAAYTRGVTTNIILNIPEGQSIKAVKSGGSLAGVTENANNAKVSASDPSKVQIPSTSAWADAGNAGKTKYVVVEVGTEDEVVTTLVIKVQISN